MGEKTNISWCDSTWNWVRGCELVTPGCANCYAKKLVNGRLRGDFSKRVIASDATFNAPLRWNKKPWVCDMCGYAAVGEGSNCPKCNGDLTGFHRRRVFSLSLGDWLDPEIPIEALARPLEVIHRCKDLDFLLLSKRPELWGSRMRAVRDWALQPNGERSNNGMAGGFAALWLNGNAPQNVWIGTSIEDQQRADERIPELLKIPAKVRFLSCEPLLGPINLGLDGIVPKDISPKYQPAGDMLHWVIVGGESGPKARPCNVDWIRSIVRQCNEVDVPYFVKQLGSNGVSLDNDDPLFHGGQFMTSHPKGADPAEWPEDLRVREFPTDLKDQTKNKTNL